MKYSEQKNLENCAIRLQRSKNEFKTTVMNMKKKKNLEPNIMGKKQAACRRHVHILCYKCERSSNKDWADLC